MQSTGLRAIKHQVISQFSRLKGTPAHPKTNPLSSMPGISPVNPIQNPTKLDSTKTVQGILGSLKDTYHLAGEKAGKLYDRIMPGSNSFFSKMEEGQEKGMDSYALASQAGFSNIETFAAIAGGFLFAFAAMGVLGTGVGAGVLCGVTGALGGISLVKTISSRSKQYSLKRALFPLALATTVIGTRFYLAHETNIDNWVAIPLTLMGIYGGNLLRNLRFRLSEPKRHQILNSLHTGKIALMNETRNLLEVVYKAHWENWDMQKLTHEIGNCKPEKRANRVAHESIKTEIMEMIAKGDSLETIKRFTEEKLQKLVKAVPGYRFPNFALVALYQTSRIFSTLLYIPLFLLFASRGFDVPVASLFMMFWIAQMIYTPTGKSFMELMEIGELSESNRYPDLPENPQLIPKTKKLRLSNQGLYREGKVPIFLIKDIIDWTFAGYKVKVVLDNDPHDLYYPETLGAVANANHLASRVFILNEMLLSKFPEFDNISRADKLILAKLFLKESLWDPTHEFDHAINAAYQGNWPDEAPNRLINKQGDEAGDIFCGIALKNLLLEEAGAGHKNAGAFRQVANIIEKYASHETRISLSNIFDDEYIELCCEEIGARLGLSAEVREDLHEAIAKNREKALIYVYYNQAREKSIKRGINMPKARAWFVASKLIGDIQKEIKISKLTPLVDKLIAKNYTEEELETLILGLSEVFNIDKRAAQRFVELINNEDLALASAYLSERPIMPDRYWAVLRDLSILALAYERRQEDSNLLGFWSHAAQNGPETPGQKKMLAMIFDVVKRTGPENLDKATAEFISKLLYTKDDKPKPLLDRNPGSIASIGREVQLRFKMEKIFFKDKFLKHLRFIVRSFLKQIITKGGKSLRRTKLYNSLPQSEMDYLANWTNELGTVISEALGKVQLFSFDYVDQFDKLNLAHTDLSRDTAGEIVFEKWLEGKLDLQAGVPIKALIDEVVEKKINDLKFRFRDGLTLEAREMIKHKIWEVTEEELEKNKNMVNTLTNGLAYIMVHEMPGLQSLAQAVNGDPRLRDFIDRHFNKGAYTNDHNIVFDAPHTFLNSLPSNLEELREMHDERKQKLLDILGSQLPQEAAREKLDEILKKTDELIKKGVGSFESTKGYLNNYWDLSFEIPQTIFGKEDLYFCPKEGLRRIVGGEAKNFKENEPLYGQEAAELLKEIVAIKGRVKQIAVSFREHIFAIQSEELLNGRVVEDYMSELLAEHIINSYLNHKIENAAEISSSIENDVVEIFLEAFFSETFRGVWNKGNAGHILKPLFEDLTRDAYRLMREERMGILRRE